MFASMTELWLTHVRAAGEALQPPPDRTCKSLKH
jgi:hypothetical protein